MTAFTEEQRAAYSALKAAQGSADLGEIARAISAKEPGAVEAGMEYCDRVDAAMRVFEAAMGWPRK
jgi:hypothetical protein